MKSWLRRLAAGFVLALLGCSGGSSEREGRELTRSVLVDGRLHAYALYIPPDAGALPPVVLALHGGGSNVAGMDVLTSLHDAADRYGFVYLRPQGYDRELRGIRTWNAGSCCGEAETDGIDHVAVIDAMLDDVDEVVRVDTQRIYATGHSNGGMMAYRLACELSHRIAAIAPNAAYLMNRDYDTLLQLPVFACRPARTVPVLHLHGLADRCAPFEGGQSQGPEGGQRPPVQDSIDVWVSNNGCATPPAETYRNGDARCLTYSGCSAGADVTLCTIEGAGHTWPGSSRLAVEGVCGGSTTDDLRANDAIWSFFEDHPIP
ncbi:MAG: PHB depolymerase family esterase [Pseudomonadota bacterium]